MTRFLFGSLILVVMVAGVVKADEARFEYLPVEDLVVDQVNPDLKWDQSEPVPLVPNEPTPPARKPGKLPVVMIRGLYPCEHQKDLLSKVKMMDSETSAFPALLDFTLERQALKPGADVKDEPAWEELDQTELLEVLADVEDYADDPVDSNFTHYVITSPLPLRKDGPWKEQASHPRMLKRGASDGIVILFRYLDFDVKPGWYYRYRVRLKVQNPFYKAELENPFLTVGETRETPWSKPSPAILVEPVE